MSSKLTALTTNPSPVITDLLYVVPAAGGNQYKAAVSDYSLVVGPASAVSNEVPVFSGTTGKIVKVADSAITITAGGTNQNITLTPSGTGSVAVAGKLAQANAPANYPAGASNVAGVTSTGAGDAGGTTDLRGVNAETTITGANNVSTLSGLRFVAFVTGSAGTLTSGYGVNGSVRLTGAMSATNVRGANIDVLLTSTGNITGEYRGISLNGLSVSSTGDLTGSSTGLYVANQGRASATTVTGINIDNQTKGSGNLYGIRGQVAAGTGKWNAYFDGTAQNYFAGVTGVGIAAAATSALTVAASTTGVSSLNIPHGAAPTSPVNGDMWTTTAGLFVRINGATVGPLS